MMTKRHVLALVLEGKLTREQAREAIANLSPITIDWTDGHPNRVLVSSEPLIWDFAKPEVDAQS